MRSRWLVTIIGLGLLALAACSSTEPASNASGAEAVGTNAVRSIKSYRFTPADIRIAAGTPVTWSNEDNFVHNVHLLDGSNTTKDLPIGGSASITFEKPGLIRYECSLHPAQMTGSVLVE